MTRPASGRASAFGTLRALLAYAAVSGFARIVPLGKPQSRLVEPSQAHGLEPAGIHATAVSAIGLGFVLFAIASGVGLYAYFSASVQGPLIKAERAFPQPGLGFVGEAETLKQQQLDALRAPAGGRESARMSIDEAMRRIAARGSHALEPLETPATPPGFAKTDAGPIKRSAP